MSASTATKHFRACHLCEAICGLVIETEDGRIQSIKGDPDDPLSRGHICPKAVALQDIHEDPDRLRKPVKRIRSATGFVHEEIEWTEALDLAAAGLVRSIKDHGVNSVGVYLGNPSVHNYGMLTHQGSLFKHIRTNNRFSATSVDQLPHHLVALWLFGHKLLFPIPDIDRCSYFLMLGANPMASNGSIWTVPDIRRRIKELRARGGKLVVIDPRRTETAEMATDYHPITPGTDVLLLLGIIKTLFVDNLVNLRALAQIVDGVASVEAIVAPLDLEMVSTATGIAAPEIRGMAHGMASADGGICYGRMGVSTQRYGALCQWAIQVINILTGNLDREGGSLFTLPAFDQIAATSPGGFGRHHSRVRNLPEFDRELPSSAMAEEMLTPGEGQIRALFTGAGNPVLSTPSGDKLADALEGLDFMVSLDPWINETTRHADVILPPTSPLEHDHYDLGFHTNAVRNTARYNPPIFDKPKGAMHDWEIFEALGERVAEGLGVAPQPHRTPHGMIDMGLRAGPYGQETEHKLSLEVLNANPSGVDLGPLKPQLPGRLRTPEQRINLATPEVIAEIPRALAEISDEATGEQPAFRLIGRRHVRDCNTWMHNFHRLMKGRPRCTLMINPQDAAREQWSEGDVVRVGSRSGTVEVAVEITDAMMPGVVSLPHGYGHGLKGVRAQIAVSHAGVSCNDVTEAGYIDELCGNAAVNGVPVTVTRLATGEI